MITIPSETAKMFDTNEEEEQSANEAAVEILREEIREYTLEERKVHRDALINKNRAILGNVTERETYTPEMVTSYATRLKRKHLSVKEYRVLQNALIQNEDNINSFLRVDNILHALVRDLSSNQPELQLAAAHCCCNIALGNTKACTTLGKSTAPYLISILESLNYPLVELAAWTIGNLVSGSAKAFEALYAQGCLKELTLLLTNCDESLMHSMVYATLRFLRAGSSKIQSNEVVNIAKAIVHRTPSSWDTETIWLLALTSSTEECHLTLREIIPSVISGLHEAVASEPFDVSWITAAIRILANTIPEESGKIALELLNNPNYSEEDLTILLNHLLTHSHVHVRKETLWLLGNLCSHSEARVTEKILKIIPSISSLKRAIDSSASSSSVE